MTHVGFSRAAWPGSVIVSTALVLLSCTSDNAGEGEPQPSTQGEPSDVSASSASVSAPEEPSNPTSTTMQFPPPITGPTTSQLQFNSPSGNISCAIYDGGGIECRIVQFTYALPPDSGCELDVVPVFLVGSAGRGRFGACVGDALDRTPYTLPYGTATVVGESVCLSLESGMTCWNTISGHGFRAARESFDLY